MLNYTLSLPNTDLAFSMIHIEEGTFDMGSNDYGDEKPIHKVKLSEFWLCEVPVTQALWTAVMGANPSYFQGQNRPVECVSWDDIMDEKDGFLTKINKLTEGMRPAGSFYRLPTEAVWEYAARGGKYWEAFPFKYSGSDRLDEVAWYFENSHGETKPVGLKTPNLLGLHDMSGNVWEWCSDKRKDYEQNYETVIKESVVDADTGAIVNPTGVVEGTNRVVRGGSWGGSAEDCRPTHRINDTPSFRNNFLGFRLVLVFSPFSLGV